MRLPRLDLRLRIAAVLAIVCISIVGTLGVTLYAAADEMEQALIEELVTEELDSLVERSRSGERVFATGPNLQYYVLYSAADYEQLPSTIRNLGPGLHEVGQGASHKRIGIRDNDGKRYVVVYDEGAHELREAHLRQLLFFSLITSIVVSIVVGYALAGVLTRQLDDLAERVVRLAPNEPHPPLKRADHDREVAALAHALDQYHTRLLAMMQREQEFTANASHELRTPLTAISTTCELLGADTNLDDKARGRVQNISEAAKHMADGLESLLRLARGDITDKEESVHLRQCVAEAAAPYSKQMADKKLQFDLQIAESVVLRLERKALQLVLTNLIKNAVAYTQRGFVRVSYEEKRLTVVDSGPGIALQSRHRIFERHYRADEKSEGRGLGLSIVRAVCDDCGWKIEVNSAPGGGSTFTVVFG